LVCEEAAVEKVEPLKIMIRPFKSINENWKLLPKSTNSKHVVHWVPIDIGHHAFELTLKLS
jgi:hypothetical protein